MALLSCAEEYVLPAPSAFRRFDAGTTQECMDLVDQVDFVPVSNEFVDDYDVPPSYITEEILYIKRDIHGPFRYAEIVGHPDIPIIMCNNADCEGVRFERGCAPNSCRSTATCFLSDKVFKNTLKRRCRHVRTCQICDRLYVVRIANERPGAPPTCRLEYCDRQWLTFHPISGHSCFVCGQACYRRRFLVDRIDIVSGESGDGADCFTGSADSAAGCSSITDVRREQTERKPETQQTNKNDDNRIQRAMFYRYLYFVCSRCDPVLRGIIVDDLIAQIATLLSRTDIRLGKCDIGLLKWWSSTVLNERR
jgi:hypothetical protein